MANHVEVELVGGGIVRVAGDLASFKKALADAGGASPKLVRFEEIPRGNEVLINPETITAARGGEHPDS
jgi:hypothetical protein